MSAARITIDGDSIEVAGRFDSEVDIDAFIDRLWSLWFAVHDPAPAQEQNASAGAPVDLPALRPASPALTIGSPPASRNSVGPTADADVSNDQERAAEKAPARDNAEAFGRLTPQQRRAVLLKRKLGSVKKVAAEMGVTDTSVCLHLKAAREKGVHI